MKYENNSVTAKFKAEIALVEIENKTFSEFLLSKEFKDKFMSELKKDLTEKMNDVFELSKTTKSDFLMLRNLAWQSKGLNYNPDAFWENLTFNPQIELSLVKS